MAEPDAPDAESLEGLFALPSTGQPRACAKCGYIPPPDPQLHFCGRCGAALDAPPPHQKCALIVDDSSLSRRKISAILQQLGCRVVEAETGHEALERARIETPDLIILDVVMPGMSGLEALKELGADTQLRQVPVVMLTSKADAPTVSQALANHVVDFLLKGSAPEEIRRRLQKHLGLA